jgi:peptide/nickel transport system ATP-binding protein
MYLGKLVEIGPARDVHRAPVHPYTRSLVDAVPIADPTVARLTAGAGPRSELPSAIDPPSGCRFHTRCPLAQEICSIQEPPLRRFTAAGHAGACHFPLRAPDADLLVLID